MLRRFLLIVSLLFLTVPTVSASGVIRIVVDEWPPFGGAALPGGGISSDVISTVLTRAGYSVSVDIVPWERALEGARQAEYDIVGNLFFQPDLEAHLTYSDPFYESEVRFMQRRNAGLVFSDVESLRPLTIAVGAGYLYEAKFDAADYLQKTEVTTVVQGVRMVANNRIDLTLDSVDVLNYVVSTQAPELATRVEILPMALAVQPIHMAVRNSLEGKEALLADFNRVLMEMRSDGSLDELLAKHQY